MGQFIENIKLRFDQSLSGKLKVQFGLIICIFLFLCTLLATIENVFTDETFSKSFYKTFFNMISSSSLKDATELESFPLLYTFFLALVYLIGVVVWSGLVIATLANIMRKRADHFKHGLLHYSFKGHIVICGRDICTPILIKQMLKKHPQSLIALMTNEDVSSLRYTLLCDLEKGYENKVIFLRGNRNSLKDLGSLNIPFASEVYIIGQPNETDGDLKNLRCLELISSICQKTRKKPRCYVNISDLNAYALTRSSNVLTETQKADIEFSSINFEESWAKIVLVDNKSPQSGIHYLPLDRTGISDETTRHVHFVIIGMSKMAESLALLAAQIAHYPNFVTKNIRTKITLVDEDINPKIEELCYKYETYFSLAKHTHKLFKDSITTVKDYTPSNDYLDIEWEFIETKPSNKLLHSYLEQIASDKDSILTLALCYDSAEKNNNIAFYLPDALYTPSVQIITKQNISTLISKYSSKKYSNIKSFGMADEGINIDIDQTEKYAKMLNFNYLYGRMPNANDSANMNRAWHKLPIVKRWSNLYSAMTIPSYERSLSCIRQYATKIMANVEHNRWNTEELLLGYRPVNKKEFDEVCRNPKYKDELKKNYIHFDIRPFDELEKIDKRVLAFDIAKIEFVSLYNTKE